MMDESCVMEAGGTGVVAVRLEDFWNPVILACHSRRHHHDHHHGNCLRCYKWEEQSRQPDSLRSMKPFREASCSSDASRYDVLTLLVANIGA